MFAVAMFSSPIDTTWLAVVIAPPGLPDAPASCPSIKLLLPLVMPKPAAIPKAVLVEPVHICKAVTPIPVFSSPQLALKAK